MKKIISVILALVLLTPNVFATDTTKAPEVPASYTKTIMTGTFKSFEEGQLLLNDGKLDFAINTDEKTLFIDSDAKKIDISAVKPNTDFMIVSDIVQTRSIPPQSYGYIVIKKTSENMPTYVEAAEVKDSEIASADNNYIITALDSAEIVSLETGKKLSASDIKKDSKLLVYASIMTMSIPAQVPAEKIVVIDGPAQENTAESTETIVYYLRRLLEALGFGGMMNK